MSALGDFLKAAAQDRGPWNCSTLAADWCIALGHPDFATEWRGVTDPVECDAAAEAGLVALWDRGIGDALPSVEPGALQPGDILVVALEHIDQAGAIWTGERLAIKASRGLHFLPLDGLTILKAWRP